MTTEPETVQLTPQLRVAWNMCRAYARYREDDARDTGQAWDGDFTADEVHVPLTQLKALEERFYLREGSYRSKTHYGFRLADNPGVLAGWAAEAKRTADQESEADRVREREDAAAAQAARERMERESVSPHIFDHIVGYDYEKRVIIDSIRGTDPSNFGIFGPPAGAKSLVLDALHAAVGPALAFRAQGGNVSRAGINDQLWNRDPLFILIDEVDKLTPDDYASLGEIAERHTLTVHKGNMHIEQAMRAQLIVAGNDPSLVPAYIRSRMILLTFGNYERDDFVHVVELLLVSEMGFDRELAHACGMWCWAGGDSRRPLRDVRQVREYVKRAHSLAGDDGEALIRELKQLLDNRNRLTDATIEDNFQRRMRGRR